MTTPMAMNDQQPEEQYGPSAMAGGPPTPPGPSPEQMRQQTMMNVVQQVRIVEQAIQDIAAQFPSAAPDARMAVQAVRAMLRNIVSAPGGQEPASPRVLG